MTKHPGPWTANDRVGPDYGGWLYCVRDANGAVVFGDGEDFCETIPMDPEAERLILAAPELLEALKKYVERDARNRAITASDDPRCGGGVSPGALEVEAAALIAKVKVMPPDGNIACGCCHHDGHAGTCDLHCPKCTAKVEGR